MYRQHCSYARLRAAGLRRFPPEQTIRSVKLYHRQIYACGYHRPKLEFLRTGRLGDKREGTQTSSVRFTSLANFLENIPTTCPHDLFRRDDDPKARASQAQPDFADVSRIIVNRKENAATEGGFSRLNRAIGEFQGASTLHRPRRLRQVWGSIAPSTF